MRIWPPNDQKWRKKGKNQDAKSQTRQFHAKVVHARRTQKFQRSCHPLRAWSEPRSWCSRLSRPKLTSNQISWQANSFLTITHTRCSKLQGLSEFSQVGLPWFQCSILCSLSCKRRCSYSYCNSRWPCNFSRHSCPCQWRIQWWWAGWAAPNSTLLETSSCSRNSCRVSNLDSSMRHSERFA